MAIQDSEVLQTGTTSNTAAADRRSDHWLVPSDLSKQLQVGGTVIGAVLLAMACAAVIGAIANEPYSVFTKEPVEQLGGILEPYYGVLAHLTWFLWVAGGTAAVLATVILRKVTPSDRRAGFLLTSALLTATLLADDFLLLHDRVLPHFGIPEEVLYVTYGSAFLVLLRWFRSELVERDMLLALAAGSFWAVSLGFDFLQEHFGWHAHVFEDGSKMVGTALWATFLVRRSFGAIVMTGR